MLYLTFTSDLNVTFSPRTKLNIVYTSTVLNFSLPLYYLLVKVYFFFEASSIVSWTFMRRHLLLYTDGRFPKNNGRLAAISNMYYFWSQGHQIFCQPGGRWMPSSVLESYRQQQSIIWMLLLLRTLYHSSPSDAWINHKISFFEKCHLYFTVFRVDFQYDLQLGRLPRFFL